MSNLSYRSFASVLAYISVVLVGASLLISALLGANQLASMFKMAADILAYIMLVIASFSYARSRRNVIFVIIPLLLVKLMYISPSADLSLETTFEKSFIDIT